jgi:hypothetical protein
MPPFTTGKQAEIARREAEIRRLKAKVEKIQKERVDGFLKWLENNPGKDPENLNALKDMMNKDEPADQFWKSLQRFRAYCAPGEFKFGRPEILKPENKFDENCTLMWVQCYRTSE